MRRDHIIVHHTGAEERDAAQVRRYHLSLGWRDVGYNYILERDGRVVEGRPLNVPGAHCRSGEMNRRGIGVALIGNLDNHPPARRQVEVLPQLLRRLMKEHGISCERVLGHREVPGAATACPGRYLDMHALRRRLDEGDPGSPPRDGVLFLCEEQRTYPVEPSSLSPGQPGLPEQFGPVSGNTQPTPSGPVVTPLQGGAPPEPIGPVLWRVLAGVYRTRQEAELMARQLHKMGVAAVVLPPD